jgi:hypothetical protein
MNDAFTRSGRAAQALWDIQAGFLRKAAYLQFSLATLAFESGVRQWQLLNALVERHELIAGQKKIAESFQPRFEAIAREAVENLSTAGAAFSGWIVRTSDPQPAAVHSAASRTRSRPLPRRVPRRKPG